MVLNILLQYWLVEQRYCSRRRRRSYRCLKQDRPGSNIFCYVL